MNKLLQAEKLIGAKIRNEIAVFKLRKNKTVCRTIYLKFNLLSIIKIFFEWNNYDMIMNIIKIT